MVCWLPFLEGSGCWYFDDFAASFTAKKTAARFAVTSGRDHLLPTGVKLEDLDENEPVGAWLFHVSVECLMWLAN